MPTKKDSQQLVEEMHAKIRSCTLRPLHKSRTNAVPGEGPLRPKLMLIGEAPGRNEDLQGKPFVGTAGKKLNGMLEAAGLKREDIFITSVNKCRPPENRTPTKEETETCIHTWLRPQMHLLKVKNIGLMGRIAISRVLGDEFKFNLEQDHGKAIEQNGKRYFLLYHPAAVIYNQKLKERMQKDFNKLAKTLKK